MSNAAGLVTAEELERFRGDDNRYELVEGRLVPMTPVGFPHGRVVVRLLSRLDSHLQRERIPGFVLTEVGFKLASSPDTVRAPDVAFIPRDRVPTPDPKGFLAGPPDLAIEVLSPDDRPGEIREKVDEYLARGVLLVVVIDPDARTVSMSRPSGAAVTLQEGDVLDLHEVLPGFRCAVGEIFE